jgi:hypothetical protein
VIVLNFGCNLMKDGIERVVNGPAEENPASLRLCVTLRLKPSPILHRMRLRRIGELGVKRRVSSTVEAIDSSSDDELFKLLGRDSRTGFPQNGGRSKSSPVD